MTLYRTMAVDPGAVSGVGVGEIGSRGGPSFRLWTAEIPGGARGLRSWMTDAFDDQIFDAIIIEDFVIKADTYRKTQDGAVTEAWLGVGVALGLALDRGLLDENIILVGASEHKTFSGVKRPLRDPDNKVRALDLAPVTPDRHEMDAASLMLQLLDRKYPKTLAKLAGPLLRDPD